jgi:hypothetical protein
MPPSSTISKPNAANPLGTVVTLLICVGSFILLTFIFIAGYVVRPVEKQMQTHVSDVRNLAIIQANRQIALNHPNTTAGARLLSRTLANSVALDCLTEGKTPGACVNHTMTFNQTNTSAFGYKYQCIGRSFLNAAGACVLPTDTSVVCAGVAYNTTVLCPYFTNNIYYTDSVNGALFCLSTPTVSVCSG